MVSSVTPYWRITMNIKVVVLNCQKCNVYLFTLVYSCKALGLLFEVLHLSMDYVSQSLTRSLLGSWDS